MKLLNLITVADRSINMVLVGIRPDNKEVGYDFKNNKWLDNNILDNPDRIISVAQFREHPVYVDNRNCNLKDFSTMKKDHLNHLKDIDTFRKTILIVKIHLSCERFPDMKAFTKKAKGITEKKRFFPSKRKTNHHNVDNASKKIIEEVNNNPNSYRKLPGGDIDY